MPSLGVNVAILDDQDRLVLTRREDFDVWRLPGGGVKAGETLTQAARREAQEETGLEVALTRLVGVYSRPGESRFSGHIFVFAARPVGGRLTPQSGETTEVRFFDRADLPDDLVQLAPRRIQHLYQGAGGSAVWAFHQDWPFSPGITRSDLYRLRDESGLSRSQFYRQYMQRTVPPGAVLELPAAGADTSPSAPPAHLLDPDGSSPAIAITVAIILQGKLLLTRREDFDVWCLPGGSLDDGESLAEAAPRRRTSPGPSRRR